MGKREVEKAASVVIALVVTVLPSFRFSGWDSVGIYAHCPLAGRFLYPFFHSGVLHAALNAWCMLSLVFLYKITWKRMLVAYLAAVTVPVDTLGSFLPFGNPTVGLSGVVYVMFGSVSFEVMRRWYYQCWMLFYIGIGFLTPNTNAWLHLYCYLCGLVAALLNKPIHLKR